MTNGPYRPTVSVVIPTYNQAEFLKAAIRSVLAQTFQDFEIIVIDNYSTDGTSHVIRQIGDQRIRLISHRNNGIIASSRNRGILASQGQYVAFLDSDDLWYPRKLEKAAEVFRENPEIGVICHNEYFVRDGKVVKRSKYGVPRRVGDHISEYLLFRGNRLSTSATVVKRSKLLEVGLFSEDPAFVTVEDYDLWIKLAKVARFLFLPEVFGEFRLHAASESANLERHCQNELNLLRAYFSRFEPALDSRVHRLIKRRYAATYYGAARGYYKSGQFGKSFESYIKAVGTYPFFWKSYFGLGLLISRLALNSARVWT